MPRQPFTFGVDLDATPRLYRRLGGVNLLLTGTTALFILLWGRLDEFGPTSRWLIQYVLIHGHLATENVLATWYSSMLLLLVAIAAVAAWTLDSRRGSGPLRHGWILLAAAFLTLSVDETGSLHERIGMRSSAGGGSGAAWVSVLIVPIGVVAAFLLGFAWSHLRTVPVTLRLVGLGVCLFLLNPVLEKIEMALIHGGGQTPGTWQRHLHDVLLVLEEGGLELFGILCFLAAALGYLKAREGERITWEVRRWQASSALWLVVALCAIGARLAPELTARLPAGDTGMLQNWFPAAMWLLVALVTWCWSRLAAGLALAASGLFGTGLYLYVDSLAPRAAWQVPVAGVLAAAIALEAFFTWCYRFRRSPRSSIASPTLRRPRPNPS